MTLLLDRPLARLVPPLLAIVVALAAPANADEADGVTEAELRVENERLRTQVRDLEQELETALLRIEALETALRTGGEPDAPSPADPAPATPVVTDPAADPTSSPVTLLADMQRNYAAAMTGAPSFAGSERDRMMYFRAVEQWATRANRRGRDRIEWTVRALADTLRPLNSGRERGAVILLQAIEPTTGRELGEPFEAFIPLALAKRLDQGRLRRLGADWLMRGTLIPAVRVNPARESVGAFDRPRFIGPFAEFGFGVDVSSLTDAPPPPVPGIPAASAPADAAPGSTAPPDGP